jgi:hypothetical protein
VNADAGAREDDAYRAVGRYVVGFSRLVAYMRAGMEYHLAVDEDRMAAALALGESTAHQIANAFFSVCEHIKELDEEEEKIAGRLRKGVLEEIKRRNDFAHGDWVLGDMAEALEHPVLSRVKPARKSGPVDRRDVPIADIDAASDEVYELRQKVSEFGAICLGTHPFRLDSGESFRVRDVLGLNGAEVKRTSPVPINWL